MKLAVIGGSGLLGSAVLRAARSSGLDVISVARSSAEGTEVEHRRADLLTGEGLEQALRGVDTILDATNSTRPPDLLAATQRLLSVARERAVPRYLGVSVVGADAVPGAYFAAKVAQERMIASSALEWTLVRATQFHEYVARLLASSARWGFLIAPRGVPIQPIAVDDVARELVRLAQSGATGRQPDLAGPRVEDLRAVERVWRAHARSRAILLPMPLRGAAGRSLRAGGLCNPDRAVGTIAFEAWAAEHVRPHAAVLVDRDRVTSG